jgi:hypothetical protein
MKRILVGLAVWAVAGCATTPVGGADSVTITSSQDAARGCRLLGQASVGASSMPIDITRQNAITKMRNRAVEMGGQLVISTGPQITMPGPAAVMNGDVYACPS